MQETVSDEAREDQWREKNRNVTDFGIALVSSLLTILEGKISQELNSR